MKQKRILPLLFLLLLLSGCGGDTRSVQRSIGDSALFSPACISAAMDTVEQAFRSGFRGCTLESLCYDEAQSRHAAEEWAAQYGAREAIVLSSSFWVDARGGDGSLKPNSRCRNWNWILTRSGGGAWELQTWGYG